MTTATAYAKFAQLQALLAELRDAPADIKAQVACYMEDEANTFAEEAEASEDD